MKKKCDWCGKFANSNRCSCSKPNLVRPSTPLKFRYHSEAAKHFNVDVRKAKKKLLNTYYVIDKTIPSSQIKWVECKFCQNKVPSSQCRTGYCKKCSKNGAGRKAQSKVIAGLYKGSGNPNYANGKSKDNFRTKRKWKNLTKKLKAKGCAVTGKEDNLDVHHILPVAFFPEYKYEEWNLIVLHKNLHIELHLQLLDFELLPSLYSLHKKDVHQLQKQLVLELQYRKFHQYLDKKYSQSALIQAVPSNYSKKLHEIHPEFAQQVLGRLESL